MTRHTAGSPATGDAGSMEDAAKDALLSVLRENPSEWTPLERITRRLGAESATARALADGLREEGYEIEDDGEKGLRLAIPPNRLIAREISRNLHTRVVGGRIIVLDRVGSTNDVAWRETNKGAPDGTAIFAEEQTTGRGRMGRTWIASRESALIMSVVLRPDLDAQHGCLMTVTSAVAVAQALLDGLPIQPRIRWPNDIMIGERKVAGILVESRNLSWGAAYVVGIGLNVSTAPEDFPADFCRTATCLTREAGVPVDRTAIAQAILQALDRWYRDLNFGDYGRIAQRWRELSSTLGKRVLLIDNGEEWRGRVLDLSLEDGLIVRLDEGLTRIFHPSTVTLRHLPG